MTYRINIWPYTALQRIERNQEKIMIDTAKILAAVADEKTESASLRALLSANTATMHDLSAKLATAIAALPSAADTAALAAVQADLDQAATDLAADNAAAAAAITANTPTPAA